MNESEQSSPTFKLSGEEYAEKPVPSTFWGGLSAILNGIDSAVTTAKTAGGHTPLGAMLWDFLGGPAAAKGSKALSEGAPKVKPAGGSLNPDSMPLPSKELVDATLPFVPFAGNAAKGLWKTAGRLSDALGSPRASTSRMFFTAAADDPMLAKAKEMEKQGATPERIWADTQRRKIGGVWKYETDDSQNRVMLKPIQKRMEQLHHKSSILEDARYIKERVRRGLENSIEDSAAAFPENHGRKIDPKAIEYAKNYTEEELTKFSKEHDAFIKQGPHQFQLGDILKSKNLPPEISQGVLKLEDTGKYGGWFDKNAGNRYGSVTVDQRPMSRILSTPENIRDDVNEILHHELSHKIANKEGTSPGASPDYIKTVRENFVKNHPAATDTFYRIQNAMEFRTLKAKGMSEDQAVQHLIDNGTWWGRDEELAALKDPKSPLREDMRRYSRHSPEVFKEHQDATHKLYDAYLNAQGVTDEQSFEAYKRVIGEAEARLSAARRKLSAQQRKETFPRFDVPEHQLITQDQAYNPQYVLPMYWRDPKEGWGPFSTSNSHAKGIVPDQIDAITNPNWRKSKKATGDVVYMSPDNYIKKAVASLRKQNPGMTDEDILASRMHDREYLDKMKKAMEEGTQFGAPWLDYRKGKPHGQEGIHRALAAKELGYERIPVTIINDFKTDETWLTEDPHKLRSARKAP